MSEDGDDPFDHLEADVGDREGDPFESITDGDHGEETTDSEDSGNHAEPRGESDHEPAESPAAESASPPNRPREHSSSDTPSPGVADTGDDPLAEDDIDGPGQREGDPFESAEQAFEKMDIDELDVDDVWDALSEAERRGSVTESEGHTYAEVSKHRYCEQCEHFSAPPTVACLHDGTEILEFVDLQTVRLVDCPVVATRRELEKQE